MSGGGEVRVRLAGPADGYVVGGLLFDFNTEFEVPTPSAADFGDRFTALLAREDVLVVLAEDPAPGAAPDAGPDAAPEPTGFGYLTLRPTPYGDGPLAQLEELYVRPDLRDRGIGTALLTRAVAEVSARGAIEVHINVDEVDVDTRRFYERHGFTNIEPGQEYRMLCYLRELA
ncbi:GNAT family N-acetyltransferase [Pimelobacter simplex]|uniref:GNAT family N-acetyltransferase n=1 Tax=Nocardioides simplex TaxID=2045 RepID=A0A7J5E5J7_NOCSI|nr:GNAT family N-acetyltransferase [Pimelobacter simplex]KAB2813558.1 GNAT family N-acetyltransferase [Pimelobacter simplex]